MIQNFKLQEALIIKKTITFLRVTSVSSKHKHIYGNHYLNMKVTDYTRQNDMNKFYFDL